MMPVTSLKQWMAAEEFDRTEPASYYVAGAEGWGELQVRRAKGLWEEGADDEEDQLYPTPEWFEDEYE